MESLSLTSRQAVYDCFRQWGYAVTPVKFALDDDVPASARRNIEALYLVASHSQPDQGETFQVFLAELADVPRLRRTDVRPLAEHFLRHYPQGDYLFIFALKQADTYQTLAWLSPRRVRADHTRLRLLLLDPQALTRTDRDILRALRLPPQATPAQIIALHQAAFSVEAVTDQFYAEYQQAFERLKRELTVSQRLAPHFTLPARHAVAQRLLSRLLFLCFVQKKYWLNQRPDYLFDLFDHASAQAEDFYDTYLHPLFFFGLNRRAADTPAEVRARIGWVPFLNGGLFEMVEPWDEPGVLKVSNAVLADLLGPEGLLRRYNFTVAESTPDFQEVAVDPEMLGKVFESIVLQSDSVEDFNAPNRRKATGSYYTPRIVVRFMVHEALSQYLAGTLAAARPPATPAQALETLRALLALDASDGLDEATWQTLRVLLTPAEAEALLARLATLTACDPAVGSGAFALGLLQELVNLHLLCAARAGGKDPRQTESQDFVFALKRRYIQQTIYGVDLQAQAVEICKLRLWLSLVVDYELSVDARQATPRAFQEALARVEPLPNLMFKIRQGDALLDQLHGVNFRLEHLPETNSTLTTYRNKLQEAQLKYFTAQKPEIKRNLRRAALEARLKYTEHVLNWLKGQVTAVQGEIFGETAQTAANRKRAATELARLAAAQTELTRQKRRLQPLFSKTNLEPADEAVMAEVETGEDGVLTFAWLLAFPEIFAPGPPKTANPGFDLVLGNPPFVTARNPEKRELYRDRWKETAYLKYQLVAPFFQRAFGLLKRGGYLGFIVSNAFAKREFGRPLVEDFFPTVELEKVVDCSGLMFPGHGTPTCIVFGRRGAQSALHTHQALPNRRVRVAAILPGGGDLRTAPEDSPLWLTLHSRHDHPGYADERVVVADRPATDMAQWPWNFDSTAETTKAVLKSEQSLGDVSNSVGPSTLTRTDEVFIQPPDLYRRLGLTDFRFIRPLVAGDNLRDWTVEDVEYAIFPYQDDYKLADLSDMGPLLSFMSSYREQLEETVVFGKPKRETNRAWYEYTDPYPNKNIAPESLAFPEIATHAHFFFNFRRCLFPQTAPVIKLHASASADDHHLLAGLLNSSAALFYLKLICFSKREAEVGESGTYFVYAGGKVQQLPLPAGDWAALRHLGGWGARLTALSRACWEHGQQLPALAYKKLFERPGQAYHAWNSALPGWVAPAPLAEAAPLPERWAAYRTERERLRQAMIGLQEEMDWLAYHAYGLINDPALLLAPEAGWPAPLALGERPFELLRANAPVPAHFGLAQQAVWRARLAAIQTNEHLRRLEQPVYKRRWYRKVDDAQELRQAVEWCVLEHAEWWLEHRAGRTPVAVADLAAALLTQPGVAALAGLPGYETWATPAGLAKELAGLMREASVPAGLPAAVPWEQLAAQGHDIPKRAQRIRGKLNVPRERFHEHGKGEYTWAGRR